jgi:methyl-accepting chemotaxis protein
VIAGSGLIRFVNPAIKSLTGFVPSELVGAKPQSAAALLGRNEAQCLSLAAVVSNEAVETGRRAAEIRDGSLEISEKVNGLRGVLVKVVRNSTADVNRRLAARVDIDRPGIVVVNGKHHRALIRDLSENGAILVDAIDNVSVNTSLTVAIDGLGPSLRGVITRVDERGVLVKFELTDEVKKLVGGLTSGRIAA